MKVSGNPALINAKLSKANGVIEVNASYKNENAIVKFDKSKMSVDSLTNMINSIGYKVISSTFINK